jgi:hypothetical protein
VSFGADDAEAAFESARRSARCPASPRWNRTPRERRLTALPQPAAAASNLLALGARAHLAELRHRASNSANCSVERRPARRRVPQHHA